MILPEAWLDKKPTLFSLSPLAQLARGVALMFGGCSPLNNSDLDGESYQLNNDKMICK